MGITFASETLGNRFIWDEEKLKNDLLALVMMEKQT
jgi:hypothetical protein